ncbi:MAG: thiamine pyrophosphate-binding protein [Bacteroidetes bacterium]|nr:thiamine pyrophosphate-binding protein [Bacteroidota bacterium]
MSKEVFRVADFISAYIQSIGIKEVFLLPGGGAMHLIDAFGKQNGIKTIACHHEQAVGISAEAAGRVRETFGVAVVTTGPGTTNIITPVAGAWIDSIPMLVISGQAKRSDLLKDSGLRQKGVQEVDIVTMVKTITKYAKTIEVPEDIKYELEKAIHLSTTGRKGPVWIDIPLDVQGAPIDETKLKGFVPEKIQEDNVALENSIEQTLKLINGAKRPLLLIGNGARLSGAKQEFEKFVEKTQMPVIATWNAMDFLPFDHPLNVGKPGSVALRAPNFAIQNSDLLISVGCRLDNIITAFNPKQFARNAKKVVVDIDIKELDKLDMIVEEKILTDATLFFTLLNKSNLKKLSIDEWRRKCLDWKNKYSVNDGKPFSTSGVISHYHIALALSNVIPENTLIGTGSSGLAVEAFYTVFKNKKGQRLFLTAGLGAMGYGLPAAIGACVGNDMKPIVAVESDGSLQLNIQEFATIRQHQLPICLVVLNNNGYTSIRNTQNNYFKGRLVGTGPEAGLWLPNLKDIAATYGLDYYETSNVETMEKTLATAISSQKPAIVNVKLIPNEVLSPKVAAIPQADGSMISMPLEDMTPLLSIEELKEQMLVDISPESLRVRNS